MTNSLSGDVFRVQLLLMLVDVNDPRTLNFKFASLFVSKDTFPYKHTTAYFSTPVGIENASLQYN